MYGSIIVSVLVFAFVDITYVWSCIPAKCAGDTIYVVLENT